MSEEQNNQQQRATTQPEGNGATAPGKTFTQEQVNQIVSERLARERTKAEPSPEETREKDLSARENKLTCKEFVTEGKYPNALLEIFDTSDADKFKASVDALFKAFPQLTENPGKALVFTRGTGGGPAGTDAIAQAFRPKY